MHIEDVFFRSGSVQNGNEKAHDSTEEYQPYWCVV